MYVCLDCEQPKKGKGDNIIEPQQRCKDCAFDSLVMGVTFGANSNFYDDDD